MAVCQLVLMDACYGTGRFDGETELYTRKDLEEAIEFVEGMLKDGENITGWADLERRVFLDWAERKMKEEGWQ